MYDFIEGVISWRGLNCVVATSGGVGYLVRVGERTKTYLVARPDARRVYVHHRVREDDETLYGFICEIDRALFEALLTVERVGPATALGIVDLGEPMHVWQAIRMGNAAFLRRARGCGENTANKIILALAGKGQGADA